MNRRPLVLAGTVTVVLMLAVSAWGWAQIPPGALIPIHWGIDGRADNFAPKEVALVALPAVALVLLAVALALPSVEPRRSNLLRSATAYRAIWFGVFALLVGIHALSVLAAAGADVPIVTLATGAAGLLLVVVGNYLGKIRSNFFVGIRTPWTLTSERAWAQTHRLGGRLFVVLGAALLVIAIVGPGSQVQVALLAAGLSGIVVSLFVYSYLVWRADPDRQQFGPRGGAS